jgi:fibulin 1/2
MTCSRTAVICCLRSLLDRSCAKGVDLAKLNGYCTLSTELAGGIRKECCDCCMLAKDLMERNEPCVAPNGFSSACLTSFNKCCDQANPNPSQQKTTDNSFYSGSDRCETAKCQHKCADLGGERVECSCDPGYDLAPDGFTCIDIDECMLLADNCLESQRCLNTPGSYKCIRTLSCGTGYALDSDTEQCMDVDECNLGAHDCGTLYQCKNTQGSYRCIPKQCGAAESLNPTTGECTSVECPMGYVPLNGHCEDIDECRTPYRCSSFEECINTPGSFRCQEKGNLCGAGYVLDKDTGFCVG